jgi:feruloyl esterase
VDGAADWCKVTVEITKPPAPNVATVWIGLPLEGWNGRFLGLGGGLFAAGLPHGLTAATPLGFAAGATDAGHSFDSSDSLLATLTRAGGDGSFALDANGRLDWNAVRNFAHLGIHDMTVIGKTLTTDFYGVAPRYSYFSGCSTGGREGQSEVQRYPEDYDGVLSGAPAINWAHFLPAGMWPQLVMNELHPVPQCKLEAARRAAVAACDREDGVEDGLIGDINMCAFDPKALVGTQTDCGVIDEQDAEVIRQIWDGPRRRDGSRLWYGLDRGATFEFGAMTGGDPLVGQPHPILDSWFKYFLTQDPNWSASSLTRSGFELLFDQSVEQYGEVFDTSRANIRAFGDHGGRTIIWHGLADNDFTANGTIQYVDSIRRELGAQRTNDVLRFYLAPGVAHCAGGDGPQPVALLNTLMDWVERGRAPSTLISENRNRNGDIIRTRPLCPYPQRARYRGRGSIDDSTNFRCSR